MEDRKERHTDRFVAVQVVRHCTPMIEYFCDKCPDCRKELADALARGGRIANAIENKGVVRAYSSNR